MFTGIQLKLAVGALAFVGGFAACEIYERKAPWGLGPRLERLQESLPARDAERYSSGAAAQRDLDEAVITSSWKPALARCQSERLQGSQEAAASIGAAESAGERARRAAYQLGRASCRGQTDESNSSGAGDPAGVLQSGPDLRDIVTGSLGSAP